jgi:hypothetical protein
MATLKKIATQVIDRLTAPYNEALYQDIKEHIVNLRNKFVKQQIDKARIGERYQQLVEIELEKVDSLTVKVTHILGSSNLEAKIYRNKQPIPTIVNTSRPAHYLNVFTKKAFIDRHPAIFINSSLISDYFKSRYSKNSVLYSVVENDIIIVCSANISKAYIQDVFEYPLIVTDDYQTLNIAGIVFSDTAEFSIDSNMIPLVIEEIIRIYNGNATDNIQP